MALPIGWKQEGSSYRIGVIGSQNVQTELITTLDGKQQIVQKGTSNVIYERNLNDTSWTTKNNALDQQIGSNKTTLQSTANGLTYRLISSNGSDAQKTAANNSNSFKSQSNSGIDPTNLEQDARKVEPTVTQQSQTTAAGKRFQYPVNMTDAQDKVRFTAVEIIPGKKSEFLIKDASIYIAVQGPITDTNVVKWGEGTLNPAEQAGLDKARQLIAEGKEPTVVAQESQTQAANFLQQQQAEMRELAAGAAVGRPDILARTAAKILNPNLELLFQGPQLRQFQMTFKMSARDKTEAATIKTIIKYFKRHMAVRRDASAAFLKAPHVFTIQYLKGSQIHPSIGKISPKISGKTKACALLSFTTDYTPLGQYATYNDSEGTMVAYTLNLQFQEIEPLYDTDYFEDNHAIGY
jgi:hypothetical protein